VAEFPSDPEQAICALEEWVEGQKPGQLAGFIGSSLGGYYSLYLHHKYRLPAVLINPAMRPYELLVDYLGENTNPYTHEQYTVTMQHMDALRRLDVSKHVDTDNLYLLTQTGDEVLKYREAFEAMPGVKAWVCAGGDHAFQGYIECLPSIVQFFNDLS